MLTIFRLRYTFISKSCFNFAFASFIICNFCIHECVQGRRIYGWNNNIKTIYRPVTSSQGFQPMTQQTKGYGGNGYFGNSGTLSNGWRNNGYSNNWFGNGFLTSPNYFYRPQQQNNHYYGTPSYNDYQGSIIDVNIPPPPTKKVPVEVKPIPNHVTVKKKPVITSPVVATIPQENTSEEGQGAVPGEDKQTVNVPEYNIEIPADTVENQKTENPEGISPTQVIENHETDPKGQDNITVDDGSETSVRIPEEGGKSENGNNPSTNSNNQEDIQGQTNTPQTSENPENPNQSSNVNDGNESAYTNEPTEPPVQADNISNEDDDSLISNYFAQNNANTNISNEDDDSLISNFAQNNANGSISNEDDSLISNFAQNNANGSISNEDDSLISNFAQNNANGNISEDGSIISDSFSNSTEEKNSSGVDESMNTGENQDFQEHEQIITSGKIPSTNSNVSNEDEDIIAVFLTNPTTDNNFKEGENPNEPSTVETFGNEEQSGKNTDESSVANEEETEQQSLPDYTDIFDVRINIKNDDESRINERRIDDNVCGIPGVTPDMETVDKTSLLPWLITLGTGNSFDFNFLCGGTIISKSIVLSSAHCFHQELPTIAKIGDLYQPIEKIKIHERYNISQAYNNIALIKLASPVNISTILEACLPNHNSSTPHDGSGMDTSVLEWKVSKIGNLAKPEISLSKILPNSHCIKAYENVDKVANYFPRGFDSTLLCVKQQQKSTYCRQGDSGVQLYHVNTDNIFTLIGTISDPEDSCGENKYPAVFTKVSSYASWIFDNALILSQ